MNGLSNGLPIEAQSQIDWSAPWLYHLKPLQNLAHSSDLILTLNNTLAGRHQKTGQGQPLHFIPQDDLPAGVAYEAHIAATGGVPTRLNLHDFFNACIWLTFPLSKAVLNARQAIHIAAHGVQHTRGVARDALTLFDENAAILVTSAPEIGDALRAFDWHNALIAPRTDWDEPCLNRPDAKAALYTFGHALMDKLTTPRKAMCAHTWVMVVDADWFAQPLTERLNSLDVQLANELQNWSENPRDFCPLPMLGVPHFCADNEDETFYNDTRVFRAGRTRLMPLAST
ncbi:DUF3025 domain-containing protein [Hydromonas duriensis]|uniref:DUF3025 family protein n=1 Tax=Hydromonas duriensis TaxID=1527608 RepID=A0A4R6YAR4_9BURK|nr:DUF3025 domain-containing protein [Hydromonas duriensis]TDR32581.1 hypothetical protein DFR44_10394 [Hydromonas duriensis]